MARVLFLTEVLPYPLDAGAKGGVIAASHGTYRMSASSRLYQRRTA